MKTLVYLNIVDDKVYCIPHELRRYDLKSVGDDDEDSSKDQMPFVFEEVFIEVPEFFHPGSILYATNVVVLPANQTIKNGYSSGHFYKIWTFHLKTKYTLKSLCKRLKDVILAYNF
jgi:hypothetical protein